MKMTVFGPIGGEVTPPASKSELHRLLIAAALCFGETTVIEGCTMSEDIAATAQVLQAAGAQVSFSQDEGTVTVAGLLPQGNASFRAPVEPVEACCGESGSTLRFLVPIFCALELPGAFSGHGRLPQRPMTPLTSQMQRHGALFTGESLPFTVTGRLKSGVYTFPGDVSSQYITGLLFALPLVEGRSEICLTSPLQSRGYVDLTLDVLRWFGVVVEEQENRFLIAGGQKYISPKRLLAQGDWSNGAFWLTAGAMGFPVAVAGLKKESLQGDREICAILRRMGAQFTWKNGRIHPEGDSLTATEIDAGQIPDLIPILAVAAATAKGTTRIVNAGRLRIKESDRLAAMAECLTRIGAQVEEGADSLTIYGVPLLKGGEVSSYNDHRIAMAMAIAALKCQEPVIIHQPMCVAKSYPNFYEEYKRMGGNANVVHMG